MALFIRYSAVCALLTLSLPALGSEIVRCTGKVQINAEDEATFQVTIVPPEKARSRMAALDLDRELKLDQFVISKPVGVGAVEIKTTITARSGARAENMKRLMYVETRQGSKHNSLIGVAFHDDGSYPIVLRADVWKAGKPFQMYHTLYDKLVVGTCE